MVFSNPNLYCVSGDMSQTHVASEDKEFSLLLCLHGFDMCFYVYFMYMYVHIMKIHVHVRVYVHMHADIYLIAKSIQIKAFPWFLSLSRLL